MNLADAIARLAAAGRVRRVTRPLADEGEAGAVAAAVNARQRAATHFAGGIGAQGWAAVSHLAADRTRLALLFGADPAVFVPTMLGRLAQPRAAVVADGRFPVTADGAALDLAALKLPAATAAGVLGLGAGAGGGQQGIVPFDIVARDRIQLRALPWRLRAEAFARGPLPATLVLGAPPACLAGAALSAAAGGEGWEHASALGEAPLALVRVGSDLAPGGAAAALFGALDLGADGSQAQFTVRRMLRQEAPVLHLLAGGPFELERLRFEALGIELAVARHVRNVEGGIDLLDVRALPETENRVVAVKFRPRVEGQSKTVLMAALSSPDLHPVLAIGVDDDIDLDDPRDLGWSVASRLHAEIDVALLRGLAGADPQGAPALADKWLIDATKPALTQPERRAAFERAVPKNHGRVRLEDFLPEAGSRPQL